MTKDMTERLKTALMEKGIAATWLDAAILAARLDNTLNSFEEPAARNAGNLILRLIGDE
jgi:hypothetical protein